MPTSPSDSDRLDTILSYFERMIEFRGEHHAMHVMRQKISWLGKTVNRGHCKALKNAVRLAATPDEVRTAIEGWRCGALRRDETEPAEAISDQP